MSEIIERLARANLLEVFGERDPALRRAAIERTYAPDVEFVDPDAVVTGWDALEAKVEEIQGGAPGFVFAPAGDVLVSHDLGYLAWTFGPAGAEPVVRGVDMNFIDGERIAKVYTLLFP